jgi:ComF family protein
MRAAATTPRPGRSQRLDTELDIPLDKRARWRLPRPCEVCAHWSPGGMCRDCEARFVHQQPRRCPICALAQPDGLVCGTCLRRPPPYARCIALADYGFPWDRLIAQFKFQDQPERARLLALALHQAVLRAGQHDPQSAALSPVDCVLPVPLSETRLAERGYNQAWELARRVAALQGVPAHAQWLQRLRDTPHQVGLSRTQRQRNLLDAMWVTPAGAAGLAGRCVALVDDVLTTGVTVAAATQALRAAGAASVQVWVLARTPAPGA